MWLAQWPQCSDAGEARTRSPSVSSQALYHWATALPYLWYNAKYWRKQYTRVTTFCRFWKKAFESVSWSFIYKVIEFFGFSKSIISWIKTFNNNVKLSVNQCGNLSSFFGIGRGCRQGDPESTFLLILCAEILGIMIRNDMKIIRQRT